MTHNELILGITRLSLEITGESADADSFVELLRVLLTTPTDELQESYTGLRSIIKNGGFEL